MAEHVCRDRSQNIIETNGLHEDRDVGLGQPLVKHGTAKCRCDLGELLIECDGEINGQRAALAHCFFQRFAWLRQIVR